jgi:hypothetical protein
MKLALHSPSFFASAIRQDLCPEPVPSGRVFVVSGPAGKARGQRPSQTSNSISSEIQAVGQTEPMCRIETFGPAGAAEALSDEVIESYSFATRADKTETTADKSATTADKSATTADKSATTADKTATTADKSATTADKTATTADKSATTAQKAPTTTERVGIRSHK